MDKILTEKQLMEIAIRDHLSDASQRVQRVTAAKMFYLLQNKFVGNPSRDTFDKVWESLKEDCFLIDVGQDEYKWEI